MIDKWQKLSSRINPTVWWWVLILTGVVLRLRQYLFNPSLWHDEACLAINLVQRSFRDLTLPLDYGQGAPIAFLYIEKSLMVLFGNRDIVLRLFPLFSGILALLLFYRIARKHLGKAGWFALALFSVTPVLIDYSSELKQYSSDVMFGLLLIFLLLPRIGEKVGGRDFLVLGGVGAFTLWASHPSAFILAGVGMAMAVERLVRRDTRSLLWLACIGAAWAVSFGVEYFVSLRHLTSDPYLQTYWRKAYMPFPPWKDPAWFEKTYYSFLLMSIGRTDILPTVIFTLLGITGFISLCVRRWKVALVVGMPVIMVSIASVLNRYPLKDRFMLFLVPLGLWLIAEGILTVYTLIARRSLFLARSISGLLALGLLASILYVTVPGFVNPNQNQNIKAVMAYVRNHEQTGDIIYVYHGAMPAFTYYAPFYGFDAASVVVADFEADPRVALRKFYTDVDALKGGGRTWFILTHITDCGGCKGDKKEFYVNYLDGLGSMLDHYADVGADAYLYDLHP